MNTFLKVFGGSILLFVVIGLSLSNNINIRRSIEIDAPFSVIHSQVNDLNQWAEWSPWLTMDPTIKTTIGDIQAGVGAHQSWVGQSGAGQLTFTESSENTGVVYDMSFAGDSTVYQAGMSYQESGSKTLVTWYMTGKMQPIIIGNYFAQIMDALMGDSFTIGLEKLKEVSEKANIIPVSDELNSEKQTE
ncbi:MAG: hypothetical protein COB38_04235 [Gammaproteobacteria bacterium]|nr:MAG: hypothetical protein COB38_04235 [Gammaproteobacteria bacterium]